MKRWRIGLAICLLLTSGCAALEGPRWALLGDTREQAFFLDRQDVHRLSDGSSYSYQVRVSPYKEGQIHALDESRDTSQLLFIEMSCRDRRWLETGRGTVDASGKILFRRMNTFPTPRAIEPGTIHFAAYTYLCADDDIPEQHNHQQ